MAKKKKNNYKQLDIDAAFDGRDEFIEEKVDDVVETSSKSLTPFDFVKDIRVTKSGKLMDKEQDKKSWNTFMVLRALSMNTNDLFICNIFNQYQGTIPNESLYQALIDLIEEDKRFHKYISTSGTKKNEFVSCIAKHYEIPERQAKEYFEIMGEEWASKILDLYSSGVIKVKK